MPAPKKEREALFETMVQTLEETMILSKETYPDMDLRWMLHIDEFGRPDLKCRFSNNIQEENPAPEVAESIRKDIRSKVKKMLWKVETDGYGLLPCSSLPIRVVINDFTSSSRNKASDAIFDLNGRFIKFKDRSENIGFLIKSAAEALKIEDILSKRNEEISGPYEKNKKCTEWIRLNFDYMGSGAEAAPDLFGFSKNRKKSWRSRNQEEAELRALSFIFNRKEMEGIVQGKLPKIEEDDIEFFANLHVVEIPARNFMDMIRAQIPKKDDAEEDLSPAP